MGSLDTIEFGDAVIDMQEGSLDTNRFGAASIKKNSICYHIWLNHKFKSL